MALTVEELGRRTKQKYPQYQNVSDAELGQKVLAKYPQYQAQVAQQQQEQPQRNVAEKLGGLLGVEGFGKSIGTAIAAPGAQRTLDAASQTRNEINDSTVRLIKEAQQRGDTKTVQKLTQILQQSGQAPQLEEVIGQLPTGRQVAGQAIQTAGAALSGVAGSGSMAGRVAQGAALGATQGAGSALENNKNVVTGALTGGTIGAAIPAGLEGSSRVAKKLLKGSAEAIYNSLVKTPSRQLAAGREPLGKGLLEREIVGSEPQIIAKLDELRSTNLAKVDDFVSKRGEELVDISGAVSAVQKLGAELDKAGSGTTGVENVLQALIAQSKKGKMRLADAQELKRALDSAVNTGFDNPNLQTGVRAAQKKAANAIRSAIAKTVPEIADANKEVSFAIRALDELNKQQQGSVALRNLLGQLGQLGVTGGAAGVGFAAGGIPGAVAGAVGQRILASPQVSTRAGVAANRAAQSSMNPALRDLLQRSGIVLGVQ